MVQSATGQLLGGPPLPIGGWVLRRRVVVQASKGGATWEGRSGHQHGMQAPGASWACRAGSREVLTCLCCGSVLHAPWQRGAAPSSAASRQKLPNTTGRIATLGATAKLQTARRSRSGEKRTRSGWLGAFWRPRTLGISRFRSVVDAEVRGMQKANNAGKNFILGGRQLGLGWVALVLLPNGRVHSPCRHATQLLQQCELAAPWLGAAAAASVEASGCTHTFWCTRGRQQQCACAKAGRHRSAYTYQQSFEGKRSPNSIRNKHCLNVCRGHTWCTNQQRTPQGSNDRLFKASSLLMISGKVSPAISSAGSATKHVSRGHQQAQVAAIQPATSCVGPQDKSPNPTLLLRDSCCLRHAHGRHPRWPPRLLPLPCCLATWRRCCTRHPPAAAPTACCCLPGMPSSRRSW